MRFQVSGIGRCYNCRAHGRDLEPKAFTEEVHAEGEEAAKDVFLAKKRLCERCLPQRANLLFDREKLICKTLGQ